MTRSVLPPPVWWGMLILIGVTLVAPTESRGALLPSTDCTGVEESAPLTAHSVRLALFVPPCRSIRFTDRSPRTARPSEDSWLARDKARHVVLSGLWTLSTQYVLVNKATWSEPDALPASVASGAAVGLAKELYDASRPGGRVSSKDLVADAVGIGLAVGVIAL